MTEFTPIPSTQRPADAAYQPISGYAVAAGTIGVIFAAVLIALIGFAIVTGRMAFSWEVMALPVSGIILAAIGRSHIRNSEGTRTGTKIVTMSWWVCVLGGAGFAAYLYANSLVLENESRRFADELFKELEAGRFQEAFENRIVPPAERGRVGPNASLEAFEVAYGSAGYSTFRNHDLVRLFARNGNSVKVEHIGTKDVTQESTGLQAVHSYRLSCPEGTSEVQIKLATAESKKSQRQQWYIASGPTGISPLSVVDRTQYGEVVQELSAEGEGFARFWVSNLSNGRMAHAILLTTPRTHYDPIIASLNGTIVLAGGCSVPTTPDSSLLPPDRAAAWEQRLRAMKKNDTDGSLLADLPFEDLAGIGFFQRDEAKSPFPEAKKNLLRELWRQPQMVLANPRSTGLDNTIAPVPQMELKPDRILLVVAADLYFEGRVHFVRCMIGVECVDTALLAAVNAARDRGLQSKADGSLTLKTLPPRDWRVAWVRTDMETRAPVGPGAPKR